MPRARDPNRDKAFEIFKEHSGDITNRKIAEMLDSPEKTISAWKNRDKWNAVLQTNDCSTTKKDKTKKNNNKEPTASELVVRESNVLTDKQWLFVAYYVKYWNATKAYQTAYECDWATANANGSRLLGKASVKEEIIKARDGIVDESLLTFKAVLQKYMDIAFADIGDYVERSDTGYSVTIKPLEEMDTSLISELSNTENGVKIKLADKMKALDMLAKYTDLLNEKELKQLKVEKERIAISKLSSDKGSTQESEVAKMLRKLAGDDEWQS